MSVSVSVCDYKTKPTNYSRCEYEQTLVQHDSITERQLLLLSKVPAAVQDCEYKRKLLFNSQKWKKKAQTVSLSERSETGSWSQVRGRQAKRKADIEQGNVCLCQVQCSKLWREKARSERFPELWTVLSWCHHVVFLLYLIIYTL